METKDRIVDYKLVPASKLKPHPLNWKIHNQDQKDVMAGAFSEVGNAGAVLVYEDPESPGEYVLINGHMRTQMHGDQEIPVCVTDLTPNEAEIALASYDKVSGLAGFDQAKFNELVSDLEVSNEALAELFDDLSEFEDKAKKDESKPKPGKDQNDNQDDDDEFTGQGAPRAQLQGGWTESEYVCFRKHEVPLSKEEADALEGFIRQYTDIYGQTDGFVTRLAEKL